MDLRDVSKQQNLAWLVVEYQWGLGQRYDDRVVLVRLILARVIEEIWGLWSSVDRKLDLFFALHDLDDFNQ